MKNQKTISILSSTEEFDYLLSRNNGIFPKNIHPIAIYPKLAFEMEKQGIKYSTIEEFYNPIEFYKKASSNFKKIELFVQLLDKKMDLNFKKICAKKNFSNKPFIYLFKIFNDSIFYKLYVFISICEKIKPSAVLAFDVKNNGLWSGIKFNMGSLNFDVLNLLNEKYQFELEHVKIKNENLENEKKDSFKPLIYRSIANFANCNLLTTSSQNFENNKMPIKTLSKDFFEYFINCINEKKALPHIAIGKNNTLAYIPAYLRELKKNGGHVTNTSKIIDKPIDNKNKKNWKKLSHFEISERTLKDFFNEMKDTEEITKIFEYDGISYFDILKKWLEKYIYDIIPITILKSIEIEQFFIKQKIKPEVFLNPSITNLGEISAFLAAKRCGIKVCSIQHGSMGSFEAPIIKYTDYLDIDYSYVYGNGVSKYFNNEKRDSNKYAIPIATGNPLLEQLHYKQRSLEKTNKEELQKSVLYVDTHLIPDFFYYGWNCYPNFWYANLQKEMVKIFSKFNNIKFKIKHYPTPPVANPLKDFCIQNNIKNIEFLPSDTDMVHQLNNNDLFIIDFPVTSLLKMLCTRKPIIVYYNPHYFKMVENAKRLLKQRVQLCETEQKFLTTINNYCENPNLFKEINNPNDEFLYEYGIHSKDSASKIVFDHLCTIANM